MIQTYHVEFEFNGLRIDKYLTEKTEEMTRSHIQNLIKEQHVYVNGAVCKANYKVSETDVVTFKQPEAIEAEIVPENIPLDILYEDSDVIVVNKPKGMVVHPAAGHYTGTLVNALMYHCRNDLSGINGVMRPGIVHRIDSDTTGALIVCKNDFSHNHIAEQLKEHSINRQYIAIAHQVIKEDSGTVSEPIGRHPVDRKKMAVNYKNGKDAVTHFTVLDRFRNYTYISCKLETGRTHQIRVHMSYIHHPLLGDPLYGPVKQPFSLEGQTLHARIIGFIHPRTEMYMEFEAPIPEYFVKLLQTLPR